MLKFCYMSGVSTIGTTSVWNPFILDNCLNFSSCFSLRSIPTADVQAKDVLCVSQDSLCRGPLSLHGRVESAAGGVWCADKESRSRRDPSGTCFQVPVDLCCGVFHGVLQNPVRYLPQGQTGECPAFVFILTWAEISFIAFGFNQKCTLMQKSHTPESCDVLILKYF